MKIPGESRADWHLANYQSASAILRTNAVVFHCNPNASTPQPQLGPNIWQGPLLGGTVRIESWEIDTSYAD
jgi:hypothetical protein